jgi:hypothetical protein
MERTVCYHSAVSGAGGLRAAGGAAIAAAGPNRSAAKTTPTAIERRTLLRTVRSHPRALAKCGIVWFTGW